MAKKGAYVLRYRDGQYVSVASPNATDIYLTTEEHRAKRFNKFFEARNFRASITSLEPSSFIVMDAPET